MPNVPALRAAQAVVAILAIAFALFSCGTARAQNDPADRAFAAAPAPSAAAVADRFRSGDVFVSLHCGLFNIGCSRMHAMAATMRARGWRTAVHSHLANPAAAAAGARAAGARIFLVGHSAGADTVIAYAASSGARKVYAIDATVANRGVPRGSDYIAYYNPSNLRLICCGGAYVRGDHSARRNIVVKAAHVTMPSAVAPRIVADIARIAGR